MSTLPDELLSLASEVQPPCEAKRHAGDEGATWVVWQVKCCPARPAYGLVCRACLMSYLGSTRAVTCLDCGHRTTPARAVIRWHEPISSRPTPAGS